MVVLGLVNVCKLQRGLGTQAWRFLLRFGSARYTYLIVTALFITLVVYYESPVLLSNFVNRKKPNKLLVMMYDGMRWDEIDNGPAGVLPGFQEMMRDGVRAKQLQPCFPTVSIPNHFCILTGMYTESHGMLSNDMYDPVHNKTFVLNYKAKDDALPMWWKHVEPIWATAVQQGLRVKVYHWMGCQMKMKNFQLLPEQCVQYKKKIGSDVLKLVIREALYELAEDKLDFVAIYHDKPDKTNHLYGVRSPDAEARVRELDTILYDLQSQARSLNVYDSKTRLLDKLNLMVVSDHGHHNYTVNPEIDTYPIFARYPEAKGLATGQTLMIYPGRAIDIDAMHNEFSKLDHVTIYRKADIPEEWHFKRGEFVPPLLAVAEQGYVLVVPDLRHLKPKHKFSLSTHGYVNTIIDMQGIFLARGPNFQRQKLIGSLENIHLYQVMCAILGIDAAPNNGTWSQVEELVVDLKKPMQRNYAFSFKFHIFIQAVLIAIIIVLLICLVLLGNSFVKQHKHGNQNKLLNTVDEEMGNEKEGL